MSVNLLTPEHLGKRVLVSAPAAVGPAVIETVVEEFSPSGQYVRLNNDSVNHYHTPWHERSAVTLLEVLSCLLLLLAAQGQPDLNACGYDDARGKHDVNGGQIIQTAALGLRAGAGTLNGGTEILYPLAELQEDIGSVFPAVPFKEAFSGNLCAAIKLWGVKVKVFFHPEDSDSLASSLQLTTEGTSREAVLAA